MTLAPVEEIRVTIPSQEWEVELPELLLCVNPDCTRRGTQKHHVVRRSAMAGPKRWVAIDGVVLLNEVPVCLWCHEDLNNHEAWIRYFTGEGWVWYAAGPAGSRASDWPGIESIQHPKSGRLFWKIGPLKEV